MASIAPLPLPPGQRLALARTHLALCARNLANLARASGHLEPATEPEPRPEPRRAAPAAPPGAATAGEPQPLDAVRSLVGLPLDEVERRLILATLDHCKANKSKAARLLQIGLKTLYRKLEAYGYHK